MRDGNVPRFFCAAKRSGRDQLVGQLAGQLAEPAFQLAAVPAFHDIAGARRKGRETEGRGEGWKRAEGMEEDGKLLVEQIKTKNGAFPRRVVKKEVIC